MPRTPVVKCSCERCTRTWFEDVTASAAPMPVLSVKFFDVETQKYIEKSYDVLCASCQSAVKNYIGNILKLLKKEEEEAELERVLEAKEENEVTPPSLPSRATERASAYRQG